MNRVVIKIGFSFAIFLLSFSHIKAQVNESVIVSKSSEIILNDANKINVNPQMEDTVYSIPPFEYKIQEVKLPTPFKVEPITPAKMKGEPLTKLYSNYVSIGLGNYTTPYFDYFFGSQRSKDLFYTAHVNHFSSSGKIKEYAYPAFSNSRIDLAGKKIWQKIVLESDLKYAHDVYHYYGYKESDFPSGTDFPSKKDNRQIYDQIGFNLNLESRESRKDIFEYGIGASYDFINDKNKNQEHSIGIDFEALWKYKLLKTIEKQKFGLEGDVKIFSNKFDTSENLNNFIVTLRPVYKFKYSALDASLGLNAEVFKEDSTTVMEFSPELAFKVEAIEKILTFNLGLNGGIKRNTIAELCQINPYLTPNLSLEYSKKLLGLNLGLSSSISHAINVDAQLYFSRWENVPFFISDTNELLYNKFNIVYDNYELTHLRAGVSYKKNERFKILLEANYYLYSMENELKPWYKPAFDSKLIGHYNLQDKFIIRAELIANGTSYAGIYQDTLLTSFKIKPWLDANLGVEYRYNKKLGFFVNFNNIAASRYYRWYNYPSYRFNFLAGFSFIF